MGVRVPPFAISMKFFIFVFALLTLPLCAERYTMDPNSHSFEMQPRKKERVNVFILWVASTTFKHRHQCQEKKACGVLSYG